MNLNLKSKKIVFSSIILTLISLSSCARLVKESEINDDKALAIISNEVVNVQKLKNVKVKKLALGGFVASNVASESGTNNVLEISNLVRDLASNRGCNALNLVYDLAPSILEKKGFEVLKEVDLLKSETYKNIGSLNLPGFCFGGNTRVVSPVLVTKEINKVIEETGVDGMIFFSVAGQNNETTEVSIWLYVKGKDYADLSTIWELRNNIAVESDTTGIFSDLKEADKSNDDRLKLTFRVFHHAFKVFATKMAEDLK